MENQNMGNNQTQQQTNESQQGTQNHDNQHQGGVSERTFTQDEVNRIVGERLARVKSEPSADLIERESRCAQRELQLDAREKLANAGLPKELLDVINYSTKENLDNSIKTLQRLFGSSAGQRESGYRIFSTVSTSTGSACNGAGHNKSSNDPAEIRKAMGLKG